MSRTILLLFCVVLCGGSFAAPPSYKGFQRHVLVIDELDFARCIAATTLIYGDSYYLIKDTPNRQFNFDQLLEYLQASPFRDFDYFTGFEPHLKAWVLAQMDYSIDPIQIYSHSLALNSGNVWGAILTIHQLVRNMARYNEPRRYFYKETNREESAAFFNKLIDIRGDLEERGEPFLGDHRGTWYRIWGMMLYRLAWEGDHGPRSLTPIPSIPLITQIRKRVADRMPSPVGNIAELTKIDKPYALDSRKSDYNVMAGNTMSLVIERLWYSSRSYADQVNGSQYYKANCKSRIYLRYKK